MRRAVIKVLCRLDCNKKKIRERERQREERGREREEEREREMGSLLNWHAILETDFFLFFFLESPIVSTTFDGIKTETLENEPYCT